MNKDLATERMVELMLTVDSLNRFSNVRKKFPVLVVIALSSVFISIVVYAVIDVYDFYTVTWVGNLLVGESVYLGGSLVAGVAWIAGIVAEYIVVDRAYHRPDKVNWEEDLKEGPIGIIKIMSGYDWENILIDMKYAKQGFVLITILQMLLYYLLAFVILFFLFGLSIEVILQVTVNLYLVAVVALLITLILGDRTLVKLYHRIWNANILIDELRRFHIELSQREL